MADSPQTTERAVQFYRLLLRVFPAAFHKEYADEMAIVFHDLAADAWRRGGRVGLWMLWCRVFYDLVRSVPREHLRERRTSSRKGVAMTIKSLLTRKITSDEADRRWSQTWGPIFMAAFSLLVAAAFAHKLASMNLTAAQLVLGLFVVGGIVLQMIGHGLILTVAGWPNRPSWYVSRWQIAIYVAAMLIMLSGIWTFTMIRMTEFELMLGILLDLQAMGAAFLIGELLPILQSGRHRHDDDARFPLGRG